MAHPTRSADFVDETTIARVLSRREITPAGCWLWTGRLDRYGYGDLRVIRGGVTKAFATHRIVYEHLAGPIPDGLVIDHLCRNRRCMNPAHLEPVTIRENVQRGIAGFNRSESCPNGHPYVEGSYTLRRGRWRSCKQCQSERQRRYTQR